MIGVLGGRALHEPPRDIDSVHVKGHPCLVHGIKSTADRLFQARVTNNICQERWGETTMDCSMEVQRLADDA